MKVSVIILIIIVVIFLLFIAFSIIYNKFQDYIIRINEVEGKIDEAIREKFDIIIKLNNIIKEKIKTKKVLVDDISKLKDKKISSFEIDRKLVEALNKINFVKSQYTELETDEDVINILLYLRQREIVHYNRFKDLLEVYKKEYTR